MESNILKYQSEADNRLLSNKSGTSPEEFFQSLSHSQLPTRNELYDFSHQVISLRANQKKKLGVDISIEATGRDVIAYLLSLGEKADTEESLVHELGPGLHRRVDIFISNALNLTIIECMNLVKETNRLP